MKNKIPQVAAEIQEAIIDVLITKTLNAAQEFKVNSIIIGGGVTANSRLKTQFQNQMKARGMRMGLHVPPAALSTDNAVMIGVAAFFNQNFLDWKNIFPNPQLSIKD